MFAHEPDRPDYMTWLMSRTELGDSSGGVLTVCTSPLRTVSSSHMLTEYHCVLCSSPAEVLANMTDILDAPQLNSLRLGEWTYWLDGIYVNGRFVGGHSNVTDQYKNAGLTVPSANSTVATFDTGTSASELCI